MYKTLSVCAIAAFSTSLLAQTNTTIPTGYQAKEGESSRHIPLRYTPARIQNGYGPKATGWTTKVIKELWARADGTAYLTTGFSCDMQVILSSKGADPETAAMVFSKNLGPDQKVFMKKKTYKFASFAKATTKPTKWTIQLKGDAPFVAITGNLVVDWATYTDAKNTSKANTSFYVDAARFSGTPSGTRGTYATYGTSCNPTNFYNYSTGYNTGDPSWRTYGYTRNLGDFVLCWLGAGRTATAIPGLKGCSLYTTPIVFHPSVVKTTATSGYANFDWGKVPAFMAGKKVASQMAGVNAKGALRFSRGTEITFGNYKLNYAKMVSHKYSYGSGTSRIFNPDKDAPLYGWINTAILFEVR